MIIAIILCPIIFTQVHSASAASRKRITFPIFKSNLFGYFFANITFPIYNFAEGFKAQPSNITLGVNEKVTIQVGSYNLSSGEFVIPDYYFFMTQRYVTFSAEFPNGNPGNVWFVTFNPPLVRQTKSQQDVPLRTNATISFTSPPQSSEFIQTTLIRIKVSDTWVMGNLWLPKKSDFEKDPGFIFRMTWPIAALVAGFGKWSGTTNTDEYYVDVFVNIKPFHSVKIQALPPSKLAPNEIVSIPVIVENQGNYNDTFNFKIRTETGYPLTVTNNGTVTLQPGEQGQAFVGVAVPANFLDTGTLHSIFIDTYSAEQPNASIATQRIFVQTQGLYFSEENSMYTLGVGLLFIIGVVLFIIWRRKIPGKTGKKPEKPWKIPEEQQHLAELKRADKNAYEQERLLMEDEYKSAMLWYKDDKKQSRVKPTKERSLKSKSSIFTKLVNQLKTAAKPIKERKEKTKKKQPVLLKKPKEKTIKPLIPGEDIRKEKILTKIRKDQEKQLRKLQ